MGYTVLLYYCYTQIDDPEDFREQHHLYCIKHNLKGRIIVAPEGINGTLSGLQEDCQSYVNHLMSDERFKGTEFKIDHTDSFVFQKLNIRTKAEIPILISSPCTEIFFPDNPPSQVIICLRTSA